jgi:hypothetical protein
MIGGNANAHIIVLLLSSFSFYHQPPSSGAVSQQRGVFTTYPPGWDRDVAIQQSLEHLFLLAAGYDPKRTPCSIDRWIRQSHAAPALIDSRECHVCAG